MNVLRFAGLLIAATAALPAADPSAIRLALSDREADHRWELVAEADAAAPADAQVPGWLNRTVDYAHSLAGAGLRWYAAREPDVDLWLQGGVSLRDLSGSIDLPRAGMPLPDRIWDIQAALGLRWRGEGWRVVGQLGLRSPSDRPFASWDEVDIEAEFYLRLGGERHGLLAGLNWGFRNQLLSGAPLPILAWQYTPTERFQMVLGLPLLGLTWRPVDGVFATAFVLPGVYSGAVTWAPWFHDESQPLALRGLSFGVRTGAGGWRALPADRRDDDVELRQREQRIGLVLALALGAGPGRRISLEAGWAFARELQEAESTRIGDDDDDEVVIDLDDAPYAALAVAWRF